MDSQSRNPPTTSSETADFVVCGGGIVGLALALALKAKLNVTAEIYEKAEAFQDDVGAGMGMYPNGLRALRYISPQLLADVRSQGYPYLCRRFERHDGSKIAQVEERLLAEEDEQLQSVGIRRWKLQKVLHDAVKEANIPIHFGSKIRNVKIHENTNLTELCFDDRTSRFTKVLFGVDGSRSVVRQAMALVDTEAAKSKLSYMGVTCIMGTASVRRPGRGIEFPSSATTNCHGCFYPTGEHEQCFQFHFPVPFEKAKDNYGSWANLSDKVGSDERQHLVERLEKDGWDDKYIDPVRHADNTVRVGFCMLRPPLKRLAFGRKGRVVLLGDAAHPPSVYTGQGAQLGLEDVAVIVTLLQRFCLSGNGHIDLSNFGRCMTMYENIRIPRTTQVLEAAQQMGAMQQKRASYHKYDKVKEELIQRDVFFHEHLPDLFVGAKHDYKDDLDTILQSQTAILPSLTEE